VKRRSEDYQELKQKMKASMLEGFLREFPHLESKIAYTDMGTAVTNDYYLGTHKGAVYGLAHTPERFAADWLRPRTPIRGLYLTGQDVLTSGVMGAAMGGVLCTSVMSWTFTTGALPMFV
jgi:all-trans-retinol 13,14-reductase